MTFYHTDTETLINESMKYIQKGWHNALTVIGCDQMHLGWLNGDAFYLVD